MPQQYTEAFGNMRVEIHENFQFDYKPINKFSFDLLEKYGLTAETHIATNLGCDSHCEIKDVEISDNKVSFSLHRKPTEMKRIMFNESRWMSHCTMHEPACPEERINLVIVSHFVYQKPAEEVEEEQKKEEEKKKQKKKESKKSISQKAKEAEEAKKKVDEPVEEKKDEAVDEKKD